MTQKEEFLQLKSREEFESKREKFKGLFVDKEVKEHMKEIFPGYERLCFDPAFPLKKAEKHETGEN